MRRAALVLGLILAWAGAVPPAQGAKYEFTFYGKPHKASIQRLSHADEPQPGDLLFLNDLVLTLGPELEGDLSYDPDDKGRLLLRTPDGVTRVIGVKVDWDFINGERVEKNPLTKLTPAEIHGLWGIHLDSWSAAVEEALKHVDLDRVCIGITDGASPKDQHKVPPLPAKLRYLNLEEHSSDGFRDFMPLKRLSALRWLRLQLMTPPKFDCQLIANNRPLEHLEIYGAELEHTDALAGFTQLRSLWLSYIDGLDHLDFARGLKELRAIDVSSTAIASLAPLSGLEKLKTIGANRTRVSTLPSGPLPALAELHAFSTPLADDDVAKFRQAHPKTQVWHRWNEGQRVVLADVNRIRARSGGTCHRDVSREKTLIDVSEPAEIRACISSIVVEDNGQGFHCMCCGSPSLEFYVGERLVATIGLHHGQSVRWPALWPSDAMLTEQSADALANWLAKHGVDGPQKERQEHHRRVEEQRELERRQSLALHQHRERIRDVLPPAVETLWREAKDNQSATQAFLEGEPRAVERAAICLRVLGCDSLPWSLSTQYESIVREELLPQLSERELSAAVLKATDDAVVAAGAARWLLGEQKYARVDAATLEKVLPKLAQHGFKHPHPQCRVATVATLGKICTPVALEQLRTVLVRGGEPPPKEPESGDLPDGKEKSPKYTSRVSASYSNRINAALVLAEVGDGESLATIEKLAAESEGPIKTSLEEALRYFGMSPPPAANPFE